MNRGSRDKPGIFEPIFDKSVFCLFAQQGGRSHNSSDPTLGSWLISSKEPMQQAPSILFFAVITFNRFADGLHPNFEQLIVNKYSMSKKILRRA